MFKEHDEISYALVLEPVVDLLAASLLGKISGHPHHFKLLTDVGTGSVTDLDELGDGELVAREDTENVYPERDST